MIHRFVGKAIVLAGIVLSVACSAPVQEKTLANGLKIVVREDHRAPVVVSQIWYKVGAIDEPAGLTGLSHVLEHMMFKGTKKYKPGEFSRIIAENGGQENAFTSRDYTAYFQQLEKSRLAISFEMEADRMQNLLLQEEEFRKESQVVMEERRLRTDDKPEALAYEKFMATAYRVHPYKNPIIGWMDDLQALTLDDLKNWYKRWYVPNNATLVVVGDVSSQEVFKLAERYFGSVKARPIEPTAITAEPSQTESRHSRLAVPAKVPYWIMGYHVPELKGRKQDWEVYALLVLAGVLDGGDSARFNRDLVRGRQIAASVSVDYSPIARGPVLFLFDGTPAQGRSVVELENAVLEHIERVKKERVSAEELNRVKAQVVASDVFGRDSVFYQAMRIGMLETVGLNHRLLDQYVKRVEAVTAEQVQAVAKKYLVEKNLAKTVLDPQPIDKKGQPVQGGSHGRS